MRPDWPEYFMEIAKAVSARASCPRASVGAVIVSADHRILATGYNGAWSGNRDCLEAGCLMEDGHCQRSCHAETNAVAYAARVGVALADSRLFLYDTQNRPPCRECQKVLVAAGVSW